MMTAPSFQPAPDVPADRPTSGHFRDAIAAGLAGVGSLLEEPSRHLLGTPGKGYRPLCLRLTGEAFAGSGRVTEAHDRLAEAIELVHVGSLIHDDILDDAGTRRGVTAVHVRWNAKVAVLAGDYLFAKASAMVASLEDPYLTRRLADIITDLCEGELQQDEQTRRLDVPVEQYLTRIEKKTASPFELACEGGARISGARGRPAAVARRFGFHFGRLFQIVDDVLDWHGDAEDVGKPVGKDLLNGVVTLPVLVALDHPTIGPELRRALTPFPTVLSEEVKTLVNHPDVFATVRAHVAEEAERAHQWLSEFPAGPSRERLGETLDGLVARGNGKRQSA